MRILVGAPIHECKEYAIDAYLQALAHLIGPDIPLPYLVDNSPTEEFARRVRARCASLGLPACVVHIQDLPQGEEGEEKRLGASREAIRRELLAGRYDAWLSLECDVIAPPTLLMTMVPYLRDFDAVYHSYPQHHDHYWEQEGMGCLLMRPGVVRDYPFDRGPGLTLGDVGLNRQILALGGPYKSISLHNVLPVRHLTRADGTAY